MKNVLQYMGLCLFGLSIIIHGGSRPNVIFILTDDQRADSLGILGNPNVKTPNMDRLIESGTFFSQTYIQGTMAQATCLPSRAMIMSGKSLFRAPMKLDEGRLLPESFKDAGYNTFATGKWHNGTGSFLKCFNEGEAVFLGGAARDHYQVPLNYRDGDHMEPYELPGVFSTTLFADAAITFLKNQSQAEAPFFCYIPFTAPHSPFDPPGKYATMYDPEKIVLPPNHSNILGDAARLEKQKDYDMRLDAMLSSSRQELDTLQSELEALRQTTLASPADALRRLSQDDSDENSAHGALDFSDTLYEESLDVYMDWIQGQRVLIKDKSEKIKALGKTLAAKEAELKNECAASIQAIVDEIADQQQTVKSTIEIMSKDREDFADLLNSLQDDAGQIIDALQRSMRQRTLFASQFEDCLASATIQLGRVSDDGSNGGMISNNFGV